MNIMRILWSRRLLFASGIIGFFVSTYLFITYTGGSAIVCGVAHGCDTVRVSQWSSFYGIPTPALGMVFYFILLGAIAIRTILPGFYPKLALLFTRITAVVGLLESVYLVYIQAFKIQAFCSWCIASAVITLIAFCLVWMDDVLEADAKRDMRELKIQFFAVLISIVIGTLAMLYLLKQDRSEPVFASPMEDIPSVEASMSDEEVAQLLYPEDLSWHGSDDASIRLIEFVDFECPACRQAHQEIKSVLADYGDDIRFAYRMFPLPSHRYAGGAALAATCADKQGSLFPYADLLMEHEGLLREDFIGHAAELRLNMDSFVACLDDDQTKAHVKKDLEDGVTLGVNSTPTLIVNEVLIQGLPSAEQLKQIIEQVR